MRTCYAPAKNPSGGFPGGSVVRHLPASAGVRGLILDPGRSQIPRSNQAREPQLLQAVCPGACGLRQETLLP